MALFLCSVESIFWRLLSLPSSVLLGLLRPISGAGDQAFSRANAGKISHVFSGTQLKYIQRRLFVRIHPMPLPLTSGSSRSLRSLGQAKASPLTKR